MSLTKRHFGLDEPIEYDTENPCPFMDDMEDD